MSYFNKFPKTVYTLDEYKTGQITPEIFRRTKFLTEFAENFAFYDEYDIEDGETPEIVADLVYNDPTLHWIILQANEIIDPRFDWPLDSNNLKRFAEGKYANISAVHHYEEASGNIVNGNVTITSSSEFGSFNVGDIITNTTNTGNAFIVAKDSSSSMNVTAYNGGFVSGDVIALSSNGLVTANISSTTTITGTAVSNLAYEVIENETKRRIRIIKPQAIAEIINEFESTINR